MKYQGVTSVRLSKRLQAVANFVTGGNIIADVGTDHAYLPIYLIQHNKIIKALAMDVNAGPIKRANKNIQDHQAGQYIETRVSDGLNELKYSEVDSIIIAGMGGSLMVHILSSHLSTAKSVKELILQPQSEIPYVRKFLRKNGFQIMDETMVLEDNKYYTVLKVQTTVTDFIKNDCKVDDRLEDMYGPLLIKYKHPVFLKYLKQREGKYQEIRKQLKSLPDSKTSYRRIQEIEQELNDISQVFQVIGRDNL